jgi:hypothetical protein
MESSVKNNHHNYQNNERDEEAEREMQLKEDIIELEKYQLEVKKINRSNIIQNFQTLNENTRIFIFEKMCNKSDNIINNKSKELYKYFEEGLKKLNELIEMIKVWINHLEQKEKIYSEQINSQRSADNMAIGMGLLLCIIPGLIMAYEASKKESKYINYLKSLKTVINDLKQILTEITKQKDLAETRKRDLEYLIKQRHPYEITAFGKNLYLDSKENNININNKMIQIERFECNYIPDRGIIHNNNKTYKSIEKTTQYNKPQKNFKANIFNTDNSNYNFINKPIKKPIQQLPQESNNIQYSINHRNQQNSYVGKNSFSKNAEEIPLNINDITTKKYDLNNLSHFNESEIYQLNKNEFYLNQALDTNKSIDTKIMDNNINQDQYCNYLNISNYNSNINNDVTILPNSYSNEASNQIIEENNIDNNNITYLPLIKTPIQHNYYTMEPVINETEIHYTENYINDNEAYLNENSNLYNDNY